MLSGDLITILQQLAPECAAVDWDCENVGLQVGRRDRSVKKVYLALDATDEVIAECVRGQVDMLITHHPMIFGGIRKVNTDTSVGRRILTLAREDIPYYAMHTNFDIYGMADAAAERIGLHNCSVLEDAFTDENGPQGIGRIGDLDRIYTVADLCELVKNAFDLDNVMVFGDLAAKVQHVAISPGSGKSMTKISLEKGAEALITGDIDHHTGIDAVADGMIIIDAGHYGIEHIFTEVISDYLAQKAPELTVIRETKKYPFRVV